MNPPTTTPPLPEDLEARVARLERLLVERAAEPLPLPARLLLPLLATQRNVDEAARWTLMPWHDASVPEREGRPAEVRLGRMSVGKATTPYSSTERDKHWESVVRIAGDWTAKERYPVPRLVLHFECLGNPSIQLAPEVGIEHAMALGDAIVTAMGYRLLTPEEVDGSTCVQPPTKVRA